MKDWFPADPVIGILIWIPECLSALRSLCNIISAQLETSVWHETVFETEMSGFSQS
jgi:hypothetical protein